MSDKPEIAPCPRCGSRCDVRWFSRPFVACVRFKLCGYRSGRMVDGDTAIAAHNELASRVPVERLREVEVAADERVRSAHKGRDEFKARMQADARDVFLRIREELRLFGMERWKTVDYWAGELGIRLEESDEQ